MSNPDRYQSSEAQEILKIGCDNPIVCQILLAWERDECTWEQALVAMVTRLNAAYIEQHKRFMRVEFPSHLTAATVVS